MMTKRWDAVMILGLLLAMVFSMVADFDARCETVRDGVLRLHILANSDSQSDQALKLLVRDAILDETKADFAAAETLLAAEATAGELLPQIRATAEKALREAGCTDAVNISLVNMYFDTRTYGERTLPAGFYDAIRITIGAGEGHNWWCVMFPPLCVGTAMDSAELAAIDALGGGVEYRLSFASVEWLERLLKILKGQ